MKVILYIKEKNYILKISKKSTFKDNLAIDFIIIDDKFSKFVTF